MPVSQYFILTKSAITMPFPIEISNENTVLKKEIQEINNDTAYFKVKYNIYIFFKEHNYLRIEDY